MRDKLCAKNCEHLWKIICKKYRKLLVADQSCREIYRNKQCIEEDLINTNKEIPCTICGDDDHCAIDHELDKEK